MSLDSDFVAKVVTPKEKGGFIIGTAYAIREGVIITAHHVIPNIENYKSADTYLRWEGVKDKKPITNILYQSKEYDIAIAECETPASVPSVIISTDRPAYPECWKSFGYAKSAIDIENKLRKPESAVGTYVDAPKTSKIQQLETKSTVTDNTFWQGMSGAPIFTTGTNQLTAIFIETSLEYETEDGKILPIFDGRLRAASIAKLLEESTEFARHIYGEQYYDYQQRYKKRLQNHLETMCDDMPRLHKKLPCCDDLVNSLNKDAIACIRDLKNECKDHIDEDKKQHIETLFRLLLSQVKVPCQWQGKHLHELNVSTRLLAELAVANLYNVDPNLVVSDSDKLIGKHVIPASQTEVGFIVDDEADEQAHAFSYALYKRWGNEGLTKQALKERQDAYQDVNEELLLRREDDGAVYRFELNVDSDEAENNPLLEKEVQEYIHNNLLPDLPIVLYGKSDVGNEKRLQIHVRSFIKQILMS